jgi:hypothetical protein
MSFLKCCLFAPLQLVRDPQNKLLKCTNYIGRILTSTAIYNRNIANGYLIYNILLLQCQVLALSKGSFVGANKLISGER